MATILVVDDRPTNRQFLLTLLGYADHRLLEAGDGAQALELARAERPDLVITDILMPTMDGYEFVQRLRDEPEIAATRVIFYTATYSATEAKSLARTCGVDAILPKPCEPQEIFAAVNRCLGVEAAAPDVGTMTGATGANEVRELHKIGDKLFDYLGKLGSVKEEIEGLMGRGEELSAERKRLKQLSLRFAENLVGLQSVAARMTAIEDLSTELLAERKPERIVDTFLRAATRIVGASYSAIGIPDERERELLFLLSRGFDAEILRNAGMDRAQLPGSLLDSRVPFRRAKSGKSVVALPAGHPPARNFLGLRIATDARVYGWLYFAGKLGAEDFNDEDERLAVTMAAQLALLYDNASLYHLIQHHAAQLQIEVNERRRAQEALRESEAGLHRAQAMAKLAHVITGPHGSFESWSDTFPALIGAAAAHTPKSTRAWLDLVHPDDRVGFRTLALEGRKTGKRVELDYRLHHADGTWLYIKQVSEPLSSAADVSDRLRWFGTLQDVTGQKRAAEVLQASEARHRAMFERAAVGIVHSSLDGRLLMVNASFAEIVGFSREEASALNIRDITHPDDIDRSVDVRARMLEGEGVPYERELRLVRKDGSPVWAQVTTSLVRAQEGQSAYFISVIHDVSERKRAEAALLASEARFRSLSQLSADWYWEQDEECRFIDFSGGDTATGWGPDQSSSLGLRRWELPGATPANGTWADHQALVEARLPFRNFEYQHTRLDGTRQYISASGEPVLDADGRFTGYRGVATNIAERKQTEERIRRLNRIYAVLSGINTLIVRVHDRAELFREACRIAVEQGEFGMAWIGEFDGDTQYLTPVAWSGLDEGGTILKASARGDIPEGQGMVGRAIRDKKPVITNDIIADPAAGGPRRGEALRKGFQSIVAMPLMVGDEVKATLTLFARERNFFSDDEMKLLTELAGDISFALDHIEKREKIDYLAYYDQLTGVANRNLFHERLAQQLHAAEGSQIKLAVVVADIERFRMINDSLGRHAGDSLLKQLVERLARTVDRTEIARTGSDHFAIVLPEVRGRSEIGRTVEELWRSCLDEPFRLNDTDIRIALKGGIALYPSDGTSAELLFRNAEAAWKKAKQTGERYLFHAPEMTARNAEKLVLENKLRQALEKEEFVLHYQPKVDLEKRRIVGVEALIRWQSPERGLVPPGLFIPLLEETGLILQAGAWALKRATLDHGHWLRQRLPAPRVAVNVSAIQLRQRDFVEVVKEAIAHGADPTAIDVEITESLLMEDIAGNIKKLKALRDLGMKISIDDFGTGYSSLGYLAQLPVHTLKIDRSFIMKMLNDPNAMTLVSTIISLAHSLRLSVVAEGVEQEEQAKMLRLLRCDEMQGYLFSKPVPFDEIAALLQKET